LPTTAEGLSDDRPDYSDAVEEILELLQENGWSFGDLLTARGVTFEDWEVVAPIVMPAIMQRFGGVAGIPAGYALGLLVGMAMGLPTLQVPDTVPLDEPAGIDETKEDDDEAPKA
jgi:hypothetical protein